MRTDDRQAERANQLQRKLHECRHQDHAAADHPDDACHLVVPEIKIERPGETQKCKLEKNEPNASE